VNVGEPLDIDITDSEDAAASSSVLRPGCVPSMLCAHATSSCSASVVSPPAKGRPPEPCRAGSAMEIFRFNGGGLSMIRARGENGVADGGVARSLRRFLDGDVSPPSDQAPLHHATWTTGPGKGG